MTSIADVANMALDECKARTTITSVFPPDGSQASNVANRQFWPRIDGLARSANWNSHRMQQTLGLLKAVQGTPENLDGTTLPIPPTPWLYQYAVPIAPRFLKARAILATVADYSVASVGVQGVVALRSGRVTYLVSSDVDANQNQTRVILTNQSQAQLIYTCRVTDPSLWDAQFLEAAVGVMASYFALPITGDKQIAAMAIARAKENIVAARVSDGNENPMSTDRVASWHTARGAGSWNSRDEFGISNSWESLAFGDGSVV